MTAMSTRRRIVTVKIVTVVIVMGRATAMVIGTSEGADLKYRSKTRAGPTR